MGLAALLLHTIWHLEEASMSDISPHWLKRWTLPLASGAGGILGEDFQTGGGQRLLSAPALPHRAGVADRGIAWGLGPTRVEASTLEAAFHVGTCAPMEQGTQVPDCFLSLALRTVHGN